MTEVSMEDVPRKAKEHFEKGFAALERSNNEYAMDMFMLALDLCPQFLRARKFLRATQVKLLREKKVGAFSRSLAPLKGAGTMMKVQSLMKKDPLKALRATEDLLAIDPLNLSFITAHCQAAEAAGMPEVAVLTLELARENGARDVKALRSLAKFYQKTGQMHDAREVYEEIARMIPKDPQAIKDLKDATALDTMQRGRWEEEGDFRTKIKDEKEAIRLEQEAKSVKSTKDVSQLIEESLRKIEAEPENLNYRRTLADLLARDNRFEEAIDVLKDTNEMAGGADPQIARQLSAMTLRKLDAEAAELEEAGDEAGAEAKRQEKADFMFADAKDRVERYPNDLMFKYDLGVLYYERGEYNEAIQLFQLAQKNPQRRIRALYYLALCFKSKGQFDIAGEQLAKASSELMIMDDTKKDILYELGVIHEASGKLEEARNFYKQIYSVDISYRDVAQKIDSSYKAS
ncbi:MAG TPA: tetratricopeptide repeat protein [Kiritimatiellia bacterium]|nr:tetratricopeptide repeat protein [Kiritimatiellia bacterium]